MSSGTREKVAQLVLITTLVRVSQWIHGDVGNVRPKIENEHWSDAGTYVSSSVMLPEGKGWSRPVGVQIEESRPDRQTDAASARYNHMVCPRRASKPPGPV